MAPLGPYVARGLTFVTVASLPVLLAAGCATMPKGPPLADPKFIRDYAATGGYRLGRPSGFRFVGPPDGPPTHVLFLRSGPRSRDQSLWELDLATGVEREALTAAAVLQGRDATLSPEERARTERLRQTSTGLGGFDVTRDGQRLVLSLSGELHVVNRRTGAVHSRRGGMDPTLSPDDRHVALVRDGELWVTELLGPGPGVRLTRRENDDVTWGLPEFVAEEEMGRHAGFWWSPDGKRLAVQHTDVAGVERLRVSDPAEPGAQGDLRPYPRPGKANAKVRLAIIAADGTGEPLWVRWDRDRYPYLATVTWREAKAPLTLVVQTRDQREELVLAVDAETGATRVLHTERDTAWLNLDQAFPRWLPDGSGFLWSTERDGAWVLEHRSADGALIRPLTKPSTGYRGGLMGLLGGAEPAVVIAASEEPTEQRALRVTLATATPTWMTPAGGFRWVTLARGGDVWIEGEVSLTSDKLTVRRRSGEALPIHIAAAPLPFQPNVEIVSAGPCKVRVALVRPRDFDPKRVYPVINHVYGGPHHAVVGRNRLDYVLDQWFADHGFVVLRMDGRGTPARGRDWERAIGGGALCDVPLSDHVEALKALFETHPELDATRVGVFGWSFGGYFTAMAVLRHPEVFKAGVAMASVTDWKDYDTHYTERYLGVPPEADAAYRQASVLTYASKLERPLLLIHGTVDDNVYFSHTLKLSAALFDAGQPHEVLPIRGQTHMIVGETALSRFYERVIGYLRTNLGR